MDADDDDRSSSTSTSTELLQYLCHLNDLLEIEIAMKSFLFLAFLSISVFAADSFSRSPTPLTTPHSHRMTPRSATSSTSLQSVESSTMEPLSIGFLGCGMIASSIAKGLATQTSVPVAHISVSRRSAKRSAALADAYPDLVSVHDDNQEIVDASDVVFVCLLPEHTSAALQNLRFDAGRHTLVSLVSTATLDDLCKDTRLPLESVFKMICLPAVAQCDGICILLTPLMKDPPIVTQICQVLGGCVQADTDEKMSALMVSTALMGSFYGILRNNREFLVQNGIPSSDASFLVGRLYDNMMKDVARVLRNPEGYEELIEEQTPGGLNAQGLNNLEELGAMDAYNQVQAALLSRIRGESDGSLPKDGDKNQ
jgi:pyrroline-5-carboxylate reductase